LTLGEGFVGIQLQLSHIKVINNCNAVQQSASLYPEGAERTSSEHITREYGINLQRNFTHHNMSKIKIYGAIKDVFDNVVAVVLVNQVAPSIYIHS
jgi:hypothetical protein